MQGGGVLCVRFLFLESEGGPSLGGSAAWRDRLGGPGRGSRQAVPLTRSLGLAKEGHGVRPGWGVQ